MKILLDVLENSYSDLLKTIREKFGKDQSDVYFLWDDLTEQELSALSTDYYYRSLYRRTTTIVDHLYETNPSTFLANIAEHIAYRFGDNFQKLYAVYFNGDYNPLHNYDMEEIRTPELDTTIDSDAKTKITTTTELNQYGFNSTDPVPTDKNTATTEGEKNDNATHSKTEERGKDTLTRKGNIGVLSSQKLLIEELNLRKYDYWKEVFILIDKILVRGLF